MFKLLRSLPSIVYEKIEILYILLHEKNESFKKYSKGGLCWLTDEGPVKA